MGILGERVARKGLIYAHPFDISQGEQIFQVKACHIFQRKSNLHLEAETRAGSRAQPMSKLHKTSNPPDLA